MKTDLGYIDIDTLRQAVGVSLIAYKKVQEVGILDGLAIAEFLGFLGEGSDMSDEAVLMGIVGERIENLERVQRKLKTIYVS